jgi:DNA-directed RNA polymerase specialized sigma subunit
MPPLIVTEAASVIGMDSDALLQQLQNGKSIVEVAQAKGISEADLTSKMLKLREGRIDEAIKNGKIDAAKAEQMKQRMKSHLSFMLNEKGLPDKHTMHKGRGMKPSPDELAALLGIDKDELKAQLKSGKSLAEIAAAKGISRDQLIAKLKEQMTPQLEQWVDRKHTDKKAQ